MNGTRPDKILVKRSREMSKKLNEGYHPAYIQGWNDFHDLHYRKLEAELAELRECIRNILKVADHPPQDIAIGELARAALQEQGGSSDE